MKTINLIDQLIEHAERTGAEVKDKSYEDSGYKKIYIAKRLGVTPVYLWMFLNGKRKPKNKKELINKIKEIIKYQQ